MIDILHVIPPPIDTLRVLVDWKCNLKCSYCCNEQPRFRDQIKPVAFNDIDWAGYKARWICISGGEPLLFPERIERICKAAPNAYKILYSNGTLWTEDTVYMLDRFGIDAVNIGLHEIGTFNLLIARISRWSCLANFKLRFQIQDIYASVVEEWAASGVAFRYWKMNDCDRPNEERVVITDWS